MPTINQYLSYAEIALASYGANLMFGVGFNEQKYVDVGMAAGRATEFDQEWSVVAQADVGDGFSAALFQQVDSNGIPTGEKVLGIRGTEASHWGVDYLADVINIAVLGSSEGMPQFQSLEVFYQQLVSTGKLGANEQFTVSGHSLGGFLAQAFTAKHDAVVKAAYTYNAPGFSGTGLTNYATELLEFFGITDATIPNSKIFNARALDGLSATSGLGQMIGYVDTFNIEMGGMIANHSIVTLVDSLALQNALAAFDPSLTLQAGNLLVRVASNLHDNTLELLLDGVRRSVKGPTVVATGVGDRNALHARIRTLTTDPSFLNLVGKVTLAPVADNTDLRGQARTDFSSFVALQTLSAVLVRPKTSGDTTAVESALGAAWGQTYLVWQTDRTMSQADRVAGKETFTDKWIADRARFIGALVAKNAKNESDTALVNNLNVPIDTAMRDLTTGRNILTGAINPDQRAQIVFGGSLNDVIDGFGKADRLYGDSGNDVLNGLGGADALEGNGDNDSLTGGVGNDTLLGGKGDDFLEGGANDDSLMGGQGDDTYFFTASWGHDLIEDSDGQGELRLPGYESGMPVGKKVSGMPGVYRSADSAVTYTRSSDGKTLTIGFDGRSDSIVVRNWQPGQLGIALDDAPLPPEEYDSVFVNASGNIAVAEAPPADGHAAAIRSALDLSTSVSIAALDDDDQISTVTRTMYFYVPTAQMLSQATADFHRDHIDGGAGNDTIHTGDGHDTIFGGAGNDHIYAGLYVPASYDEGFSSEAPYPNYDSYFLPDGTEVVTTFQFNMDMGEAEIQAIVLRDFYEARRQYDSNIVDAGDGTDVVYAGWGDDVAHGGTGDDALLGQAGDDALFGDDGNDSIYGDSLSVHILQEFTLSNGNPFRRFSLIYTPAELHGRDTLDGGIGNDWLFGMGSDDKLFGGAGNDSLFGDTDYDSPPPLDPEYSVDPEFVPNTFHGSDFLDGGDGADQLVGGAHDDRLSGGTGNDRMWGDSDIVGLTIDLHGDDTLDGGDGDDSMMGGGGSDEITGSVGNDSIFGDDAESVVAASAHGDDMIDAGDGSDTVFGGGGADFILGEAGDDQLAGDDGTDSTLAGDDWIDGGDGNDLIFGDGGSDWIQGGSGVDSLRGGIGSDTLEGGADRDDLSGGTGNDTFRFDVGDSVVDGAGFGEAIRDDGGFDSIAFGAQVDLNSIHVLGDGQALLAIDYSGTDRVAIAGGLGGTIESFQFADGSSLTWTELVGRTSDTSLLGQTSAGTSVGLGGKNDDAVAVAGGLGIVSGGRGNDTLSGSGGGNSYHYSLGDGSDVITDLGGTNPSTGAPLPSSTIVFGAGIVASDITLTSDAGLVLRVGADAADRMRIVGFDPGVAGAATNIDRFVFADGTVLDHAQLVSRGFDFDGSAADDSLQGTNLIDRFAVTGGNDTLRGGAGSDTYGWGRDSGQVRIDDADGSTGSIDTLRVQIGLTAPDLALYRVGDDLLVRDRGGSATATVVNHFAGAGLEAMLFDDGTSWDAAQILAHLTNELTEGNDNFTGTSAADVIEAKSGNDTVRGGAGNDVMDGGAGNDSMFGDGGDDSLVGGAGTDILSGGSGNDTLVGGESMSDDAGNDTYALASWQGTSIFDFGAAGVSADTLILPVPAANVLVLRGYNSSTQGWDDLVLRANGQLGDIVVERYFERMPTDETYKIETIRFADSTVWTVADVFAGDVAIRTTEGNDFGVTGYRWSDVIDGKGGNDGINGQPGDDTLIGGAGDDSVYGDEGSDSIAGGAGADVLYGGSGNYVQSGDGADTLEGGGGSDTLYGGGGNDRYRFGRGSDVDRVEEVAGSDRVVLDTGIVEGDVTLHRNGQDLVVALDGSAVQLTVANHFTATANQIEAIELASGVVWDAAAIASRTVVGTPNSMVGTAGNDTFVVDNAGDTISEAASQGTDTVQSTINWTLGANLENLTLTGFINTVGYGNALDNVLTGNLGHNELSGGGGRDTLVGGAGNDVLRNNDIVTTSDGQADSLAAGAGDDAYWVSAVDGDLVVEAADEGIDTVNLRADFYQYALPGNVENLSVQTVNYSFGTTLIGNSLNNVITAHRNYGGFVLDGGAGADTLIGAELETTFVVDNVGDVVIARGNDRDTVISSVNWTLGADVEHLRLTAGAALGTGNALNNKLTGNGQSDTLFGLDGNDTFYGDVGANYNAVGLDSFIGGDGDDQYFIDWTAASRDLVVEDAAGGNDTVSINGIVRSYSVTEFLNVEGLILQSGSGASNLTGDGGDNYLQGNSSNNTIDGGGGNDALVDGDSAGGGAGGDVLRGGTGVDTLTSWYGDDLLDGGAGDDSVEWASAASSGTVVFGWGMGSDVVNATGLNSSRRVLFNAGVQPVDLQLLRTGADLRISLGASSDGLTIVGYFTDASSWTTSGNVGTFEFADGAYVTAQALAARALAGNSNAASSGSDLLFGSDAADTLAGLEGNDQLLGGGGDDDLAGNAGSDTMFGGRGDDLYRLAVGDGVDFAVDAEGANDRVRLAPGIAPADVSVARSGLDLVLSLMPSSDALIVRGFFAASTSEIESIQFADGTVWDNATIKDLAGKIMGSTGADNLVGTNAADRIYGLAGNDSLSGLEGDDLLDGGTGNDTMVGGLGNDTFVVDSTSDVTTETSGQGTDTVQSSISFTLSSQSVENLVLTGTAAINGTGNSLANTITGNGAANALSGGSGADTLIGGGGNDTYTVDNTGDVITELTSEGTELVQSSVSYTLSSEVEDLTLTGSSGLSGTGNALANVLTGNSGANALTGGAGNDRINGGTGNDTMIGGTGDDTYVVNVSTDVVTELAGEGTDTVESAVTLTLGSGNTVENLTLTGSSAINGTGNGLNNVVTGNSGNNTLTGNAGNDTLNGGTGTDTMRGGTGDDAYVVERSTDSITENTSEGIDTVLSSLAWTLGNNLENLTLTGSSASNGTGNTLANVLTGNSGANTLQGLAGNDTYDGGAGNDTLTDNATASNDVYRWGIGSGVDTISDAGGSDRVELGAGITASEVLFTRAGNNLELTISGNSSDKLVVSNWYVGTANRIEDFRLSGGASVPPGQIPAMLVQRESLPRRETAAPVGLAQQAQLLASMMAAFDTGGGDAGIERQTILPVPRSDAMWVSPAVM